MANKNKEKGKRFENAVAKQLTDWVGLPFHRVIGSGALLGGKNAVRMDQYSIEQQAAHQSDIHCPKESMHLAIECKSRQDFPFHQLFTKSKEFESWIAQVLMTIKPDQTPILVFKAQRKPALIAVRCEDLWNYPDNFLLYSVESEKDTPNHTWEITPFTEQFIQANRSNFVKE